MVREVLSVLRPGPLSRVVDGTLGTAGHALEFARLIGSQGILVGLDRDPAMLAIGARRLNEAKGKDGPRLHLVARPYEEICEVLQDAGMTEGVDAILLDLGVNSLQLENPERGFAFSKEGPLDGRFNTEAQATTMADLVNNASERELADWLRDYADERLARPIARRIAARRALAPLRTTTELAELVREAYPPAQRFGRIHPATRTFQALRIAVNDEMGSVERGLKACMSALAPGGVLASISFHSIEDRITKRIFQGATDAKPDPSNPYSATTTEGLEFELPFRRPIACTAEEAESNPRARSAKLRAIRRMEVTS